MVLSFVSQRDIRFNGNIFHTLPIVAQQLAQESGYHSYSTFSTAFKRRMDKSVTAWMREEEQAEDI
jgi:AraC-like DNA-binding protein